MSHSADLEFFMEEAYFIGFPLLLLTSKNRCTQDSVESGTPQSYHMPDWSLMLSRNKIFKDLDAESWKAGFPTCPAFNLKYKVLSVLHVNSSGKFLYQGTHLFVNF